MTFEIVLTALSRIALIALFLPFSALDKVLNFRGAVGQAQEIGIGRTLAAIMIAVGFLVEVVMSAGILTGIADRFAALVLALYCAATAILYKRFWAVPGFGLTGAGKGREMFFDFWKNFAVAGGFLVLALGPTAADVDAFLANPFASSHPYAAAPLPGANP
ncbi:DoxX family membrane protein [Acuticoccus sp. MNP-M23]|uniref:DoxX family protein n=1 Tax=Acuticoccus sp. MNP-M23 TaxID=3072793 RepID=UPI002815D6D6|nr:DoxX family membrane protein [Acuticoccus sp. MNP-M23]WMS41931.1 DoxX family membrane protein [Acuticoccus sp. MNP-M23]